MSALHVFVYEFLYVCFLFMRMTLFIMHSLECVNPDNSSSQPLRAMTQHIGFKVTTQHIGFKVTFQLWKLHDNDNDLLVYSLSNKPQAEVVIVNNPATLNICANLWRCIQTLCAV